MGKLYPVEHTFYISFIICLSMLKKKIYGYDINETRNQYVCEWLTILCVLHFISWKGVICKVKTRKSVAKLLSLLLSGCMIMQMGGGVNIYAEEISQTEESTETILANIETDESLNETDECEEYAEDETITDDESIAENEVITDESAEDELIEYDYAHKSPVLSFAEYPLAGAGTALNDTQTYAIFRYHHPDGTIESETYPLSGTGDTKMIEVSTEKIKPGETYTGYLVSAGTSAVSANGSEITVNYKTDVSTVKVEVYYSTETVGKYGGVVESSLGYDTKIDGTSGKKIYDTSRLGLHTDKTAKAVNEDEYGNTRYFDLTLESWYVDKSADVAMVVDASGSMAWSIDQMTALTATGTANTILTDSQVNQLLDKNYTDNSLLQYSGYRYFVYDPVNEEYVALGYADNIDSNKMVYNNSSLIGTANVVNSNGWYYVNTTSNENMRNGSPYSMKLYQGFENSKQYTLGSRNINIPANSPSRFYIGTDGYLHCLFSYKSVDGPVNESKVFVYKDGRLGQTKVEALQESIGVYQSIMSSLMPSSRICMTRFSSNNFDDELDKLVLMDWTSDSQTILNAVSQNYGDSSTTGTVSGTKNTLYNYYLTGGTYAYTGVQAFETYLKGAANGERNSAEADKYLILFTDGKDQEKYFTTIKNEINSLKSQGYTIITVFLESDGMTQQAVQDSVNFLSGLATVDPNDGQRLFHHAVSNNNPNMASTHATLNEIFKDIAKYISDALTDYTVVDYIDPRFDVVDNNGTVLTSLDENGNFPDDGMPITTADGKIATLKYNADEEMFYIEWTLQDIPTAMKDTNDVIGDVSDDTGSVKVWSSTIHLKAKDDFIGGNDIYTNGNGINQNRVYYNDANINNDYNPDTKYPAKDFPRTTANPALLDLEIYDIEDTFFLGETVTIDNFDTYYNEIVDNSHYIKYLKRLALYEGKSENYYVEQLITNGSLELDYQYIPNNGDEASYTGSASKHQQETFGTIKYQWVQIDENGDEVPVSDYGAVKLTSTEKLHYRLKITYTADSENARAPDNIKTGGSDLTRDPVGTEQVEEEEDGKSEINIVDGQLRVDKRLNYDNLKSIVDSLGERTITFAITRSYNADPSPYATVEIKTDGQKAEITIADSGGNKIGETKTVMLSELAEDSDGFIVIQSDWLTGLPIGEYTITERPCAPYSVTNAAGIDSVDDSGTGLVESNYLCGHSATDISVSLYIGKVYNNTPDTPYTATATVGEKYYLNARVGEAMLTNTWLYSIPSAGGTGTYTFTFTGTVLTVFALLRLMKRRGRNQIN